MRSTASIVLLPLLAALCLPSSHAQVPQQTPGQVVFEKVATVGMQAPDTQLTLDSFEMRAHAPSYFLQGGTVVFWANTRKPSRFGLYSAKDGRIKTIAEGRVIGGKVTSPNGEGVPEAFDFDPPSLLGGMRFLDLKAGGSLLYLTMRFGVFSKTRSVCVWDGDKLRPLLWRGESPAWLGGEKIQAAEVVAINPDGSAMIVYSTENGRYGIASHSKAAGLHPLLSTADPLPGMPGVTPLKETFEPLFERIIRGRQRWLLAPPQLLGDTLFLLAEPSGGHPFLARIAGGKTERILEAEAADPTDPGFLAEQILAFKAVTPGVVAVEIDGGKAGRRLLVSDQGNFSRVYQSAGAYEEVAARVGFKDATGIEYLDVLHVLSPETKSFCAFATEIHSIKSYATQVRCFDGSRMNNVTGPAVIGTPGEGNFIWAIPGVPGVLAIDSVYVPATRGALPVKGRWMVSGDAAGQPLRPILELYSSGDAKYTLGDVIGVDQASRTAWFRLADGIYKVRAPGN